MAHHSRNGFRKCQNTLRKKGGVWEVTAMEVTWHNHTAEAALALVKLSRQQLRRSSFLQQRDDIQVA